MSIPFPTIPRIFVSHSRHDDAFCIPFTAHLRDVLQLTDPEHIFFDVTSMRGGDAWFVRMQREVLERPIFMVILSPYAVRAEYVRAETGLALQEVLRNRDRAIIPVLFKNCRTTDLHPLLTQYQWIDFARKPYEVAFDELVNVLRPLAARYHVTPHASHPLGNSLSDQKNIAVSVPAGGLGDPSTDLRPAEVPGSSAHGPPFDEWQLRVPDSFVGRIVDLQWLLRQLRGEGSSRVIAIHGLGGIGKTTLAAVAVRHLRDEGCFRDGIAVMPCQRQADAAHIVRHILSRFDPFRRPPEANDLSDLAEAARQLLQGKDALIVLDDIEPTLPADNVVAPLRASGVMVLITARHALPSSVVSRHASRALQLPSADEALELFALSLDRPSAQDLTPAERVAAERIVATLGRHTFAVKLAGAYAADFHRDLKTLARELEDPQHAIELPEGETPRAVAVAFAQSIEALPSETRRLFASLGAISSVEFGRQAVLALGETLGLARPETSLSPLVLRALVDSSAHDNMPEDSDCERLRLHPLLHAYSAWEFAHWPESERDDAYHAVARWYAKYVDEISEAAVGPDEVNITGALRWAHDHGQDKIVAALCSGMQYFWRDRGHTAASLEFLPWGIAGAEATAKSTGHREDHLRAAGLALTYGQVLQNTGKLDDAERIYLANLAIRRELNDSSGEAVVLTCLGQLAQDRGRLEEAEDYLRNALALDRESEDRLGEGIGLNSLGQIAQDRGRPAEAADYFRQALAIAMELKERSGEGAILISLGVLALDYDRLEEAEAHFQRALAICGEMGDRRREGIVLHHLGQIALTRGFLDTAEGDFQRAMTIHKEVQDRRSEGIVLGYLGQLAQDRGQWDEADHLLMQALAIHREVQNRRDEGRVLGYLGKLALAKGNPEEADAYFQEALAIRREVQDRPGEGIMLGYLGEVALAKGQLEDAEAHFQQALAIHREVVSRRGEEKILGFLSELARARGQTPPTEPSSR